MQYAGTGDRFARVGLALALAWVVVGAYFVRGTGDDWKIFWNAGHYLGTPALITAARFVYLPGAAWALWPFAHLSIAPAYFVYVGVMVAAALVTAWLAGRIYGISFAFAALMALAWFPFTIAICLGQNAPVALLLIVIAVFAVVREDDVLAGISVGLLLYKPSDAIFFVFLLLILRRRRALIVTAACAVGWYFLSVAATNDWSWPLVYLHTLADLYRGDVVTNADYAVSIPTMLSRLGSPTLLSWGIGALIVLASAPLLVRVSRLEAASVMPLIGLAASPHAWGYEAMLALPAMWYAARRPTGATVALLILAYALAPFSPFARHFHFDALAIPVLGGTLLWFVTRTSGRRKGLRGGLSQWTRAQEVPLRRL